MDSIRHAHSWMRVLGCTMKRAIHAQLLYSCLWKSQLSHVRSHCVATLRCISSHIRPRARTKSHCTHNLTSYQTGSSLPVESHDRDNKSRDLDVPRRVYDSPASRKLHVTWGRQSDSRQYPNGQRHARHRSDSSIVRYPTAALMFFLSMTQHSALEHPCWKRCRVVLVFRVQTVDFSSSYRALPVQLVTDLRVCPTHNLCALCWHPLTMVTWVLRSLECCWFLHNPTVRGDLENVHKIQAGAKVRLPSVGKSDNIQWTFSCYDGDNADQP